VIERSSDAGQRDGLGGRAAELLQLGERDTLAGRFDRAERLLVDAWTLAHGDDPAVADTAAWALAWLFVRREAFGEAQGWFDRVTGPPTTGHAFWAFARAQLRELCARAGGQFAPALARAEHSAAHDTPEPAAAAGQPLPPLRVTSLGRFQLTRGAEVLDACKTRRSIGILRYLLTRRHRSASKAELMELFWPGADPRQAAHSLHTAISNLRRYLGCGGASYLLYQGGYYLINPQAQIEDDCALFQQLLEEAERHRRLGDDRAAEPAYLRALACYEGDYAADERELVWAAAERERLRALQLAALEQLGRLYAAQARLEAAIDCYQRLLRHEAHREDIHALVMECYRRLGRRGEALRQYERCADVLARDLRIAPADTLRALYHAIVAEANGGLRSREPSTNAGHE
jgi:DNA-binding SARP family transcriptional activator